jgi:hypothetical protein
MAMKSRPVGNGHGEVGRRFVLSPHGPPMSTVQEPGQSRFVGALFDNRTPRSR